ncbi:hypothetical protein [Megalodesulfovibrio gigas]|uniref:Uncharacterized protein n=1 Tax=Megalodesulfovibrio gigas (strain ATCC 19364 / DSM 1382 / NCIMB 9332 / VKM B-1759) TaxID=1121448 RepID=T2G8W3_MEGG1|nr:hypothetical protein [Megalodesulfovibrio gigas]AGW12733.1 hypothetical protein DGI_0838 [Megalodesulfovibrio gigas DSM 1382 = ATCC 19364]
MNTPITLLDKALALAEEEMTLLQGGDVDGAHLHAAQRIALTEQAWTLRTQAAPADPTDPARLTMLQEKLLQLQAMQHRLTAEARRLHASIKAELLRSRKEGARHAAYGRALRPATAGIPNSRFCSKRS